MNPNRNTSTWQELALLTDHQIATLAIKHPERGDWSTAKSFQYVCHRVGNIQGLVIRTISIPKYLPEDRLTTAEDLVAAMNIY